jgi:hypothetical protein
MDREKKLLGKVLFCLPEQKLVMIEVANDFGIGDRISIQGPETHFNQEVCLLRMKVEDTLYVPIKVAIKGNLIVLKVHKEVKKGDLIYSAS